MSLKYQRIKKQDEKLWPPIKWILRAFSSITLAVILLTTVCIYGTLTSVPIGKLVQIPIVTLEGLTFLVLFAIPFVPAIFLGRLLTDRGRIEQHAPLWFALLIPAAIIGYFIARQGWWGYHPERLFAGSESALATIGAYIITGVVSIGFAAAVLVPAVLIGLRLGHKRSQDKQIALAVASTIVGLLIAIGLFYIALEGTVNFTKFTEVSREYAATTLYRLPAFEMTELEFYSWWPFQLVLGLFVANLIVATIRRIEFSFVNIGVLTVHTGIILIAVGSMVYGSVKKEGDILVVKSELGGDPVSHFYDRNKPALFLTHNGQRMQIPLPNLPRYNDYDPDNSDFEIKLHEIPAFREVFGPDVKATIPGFYAYANLRDEWREATGPGNHPDNPRLTMRLNFREQHFGDFDLIASDPQRRVQSLRNPDTGEAAVDFGLLVGVDEDWLEALVTPVQGRHAVIVEVPGENFKEIYTFDADGEQITVGDTGYTLSVEQVYPQYPFPILTEGYEDAQASAAVVVVETPDGRSYQRWAIDPYPQLTQDFVSGGEGGRPQRVPPNPEIDITYIDASRTKIFAVRPEGAARDELSMVTRLRGGRVNVEPMVEGEGVTIGGQLEVIAQDYTQSLQRHHVPVPVPERERVPSEEGNYAHAAVPVEFTHDGHTQRVWLAQMQYLEHPQGHQHPETVNLGDLGEVEVAFGRVREPLPFQMELLAFEMVPVPGTGNTDNPIPQNYISDVLVTYPDGSTREVETFMNNPAVVRAISLSDALNGAENRYLGRNASFGDWLKLGKIKVSQMSWDPQGQRWTGLGIGNNAAIRVVALGAILIGLGTPWAFYVKPAILRARKRRIQADIEAGRYTPPTRGNGKAKAAVAREIADTDADAAPAEQGGKSASKRDRQHDPTSV